MNEPCPICGMLGGFHDRPHSDVPKKFILEKDWLRNARQLLLGVREQQVRDDPQGQHVRVLSK